MKIEPLLIEYLRTHKSVSLEEIGILSTGSSEFVSIESDESIQQSDNSFEFECNKTAKADVGLINYIVEKTGKLKPLIAADIQSFTVLGKQFLNIGKPFVISPIGYILKNQQDQYEFFQGENTSQPIKTSNNKNKKATTVYDPQQIDFSSPSKKNQTKPFTQILLIVICLFVPTIVLVYMYMNQQNKTSTILPIIDTFNTQPNFNYKDTSKKLSADTATMNLDNFQSVNISDRNLPIDSTSNRRVHPYKKKKTDSAVIKDSILQ